MAHKINTHHPEEDKINTQAEEVANHQSLARLIGKLDQESLHRLHQAIQKFGKVDFDSSCFGGRMDYSYWGLFGEEGGQQYVTMESSNMNDVD